MTSHADRRRADPSCDEKIVPGRKCSDYPRIRKLPSGNFKIRYHSSDWKPAARLPHICDQICGTGCAAAVEADAEIQRLRKEFPLTRKSLSLAEATQRWENQTRERVRDGKLKPDSIDRYRRALEAMMPLLDPPKQAGRRARRRLARDVFPHTVAGLCRDLTRRGSSESSQQVVLSVLDQILAIAVESGDLGYNAVSYYRHSRDRRRR